jgi:hypothetical protein
MAEHPWDDDVVLEQAHAEHGEAGAQRDLPGDGEADPDRHGAGRQRTDDGDDLDDPREDPEQQPERHSDHPESKREHRGDEGDQDQLAADEGAELGVDQVPGVANGLAPVVREQG